MKAGLVAVLLLLPVVAVASMTPGAVDASPDDQAWFLNRDKYPGSDTRGGAQKMDELPPDDKQITINAHTEYFVAEAPAESTRAFGRLPWTLIAHCNADNTVHWSIGYWLDGTYVSGGGQTALDCQAGQSETDYAEVVTHYTPLHSIQIPAGAYLTLAITDNDGNLKLDAGPGKTRISPAEDAPDYDAPRPSISISGVRGPSDPSPIQTYQYPSVAPGASALGLYWIQIDVQGSPVQALRFDVPAMTQGASPLPTAGALQLELRDAQGATVATTDFVDETVTLLGSFLGTYHARLGYQSVGAGANQILPAGTYDGTITVTARVHEGLHLTASGGLTDIGPDAPGSAIHIEPGDAVTFSHAVTEITSGDWRLDLLADGDGSIAATTIEHVASDGTSTTILTSSASAASRSLIGAEGPSDFAADGGTILVTVTWPMEATQDLVVWTHAPDAPPSGLLAPIF